MVRIVLNTLPLARQLNLFDVTMIVMGGIIGSGIFMNPYVVARAAPNEWAILGVWAFGGAVAMAGAFVYADLAARNTAVGGQYAYLRDGWHPSIAFLYGWSMLLVIQTGGMAAVAVTFANYLVEMTGFTWSPAVIASITLMSLAGINLIGVRSGSAVQNILMLLKIAAIATLIFAGVFVHPHEEASTRTIGNIGGALTPVLFAYGGWQTASFLSGEMKNPRRDLARGVILGVSGVVILYLLVNWICVRALGADGLAHTPTPASAVMRLAFGSVGGRAVAAAIALSTLGFLSQGMLTAPRIYYAMARDRVFFEAIGTLYERTQVPAAAILLQAVLAAAIAFSGTYDKILSYVVSIDFIFFGLTGAALFRKDQAEPPAHYSLLRRRLLAYGAGHHPRGTSNQRHWTWHPGSGRASLLAMDPQDSMKSDYMHWAKTKSRAKYNLATSGVPSYPLEFAGPLEINGPGGYGYTPLLEAIGKEYNVPVECIVPGGGTSGANMYAFLLLLKQGDEALVEFPAYETLPNLARFTGAKVNRFTRGTDIADAITPKTKLIVLTNLHNPTSALLEEPELIEIGKLAEKVGAHVLVDEVYLDCVWDRHVRSAFHLGPNFLVTSSLTKIYGLSGLRCGWIFAQPDIAERLWRLIDLFDNIPAHPAELLSVSAFEQLPAIRAKSKHLIETNREIYRPFAERHNLEVPAQGTVVFPKIPDKICDELRDKYETTVVPGHFFGMPDHIRISLVTEPDVLREGLARLEAVL